MRRSFWQWVHTLAYLSGVEPDQPAGALFDLYQPPVPAVPVHRYPTVAQDDHSRAPDNTCLGVLFIELLKHQPILVPARPVVGTGGEQRQRVPQVFGVQVIGNAHQVRTEQKGFHLLKMSAQRPDEAQQEKPVLSIELPHPAG